MMLTFKELTHLVHNEPEEERNCGAWTAGTLEGILFRKTE